MAINSVPSSGLVWDVSGRLLRAAGRDPADHTILRENLATMLTSYKSDFVDRLRDLPQDKLLEGLNDSYANGPIQLGLKISRDIRQQPFNDAAVLQRLKTLDAKLKEKAASIVEHSRPFPCKFYIAGSLEKGRFGANSDVDLLCQASPTWMQEQRRTWTTSDEEDVSVQWIDLPTPEKCQTFVEAFGPSQAVTLEEIEQPGFLMNLYEEGLHKKGYQLENGHLKATGPAIQREPEPIPEAAKTVNWFPMLMMV